MKNGSENIPITTRELDPWEQLLFRWALGGWRGLNAFLVIRSQPHSLHVIEKCSKLSNCMFALDPILVIVWVLMKPVSLKKKTNKKNR